jgi:tetratricopeptide (TPR) repeat protein
VRDAVLARAARLSADARALLEAVAVVPPQAELWLLEAMAGDHLDRLEECVTSGMLRQEARGVAFRHELERLAMDESLLPNRRRELHGLALSALAGRSGPPDLERLAHHADTAGDIEAVLRFAPAAAERAASLGAHREAAAQYARALRFGTQLEPNRRADLLERRSHECYLTDQHEAATDALKEVLALRRELGDPLREGDALRALSEILWCPGSVAMADEAGRRAVALLEHRPPGRELGRAYANLASLGKEADDLEEAVLWGGRALEVAERLGDVELLVHALASIGGAEAVAGIPSGRVRLDRSLELANEHELVEQAGRIGVLQAWALVRNRSCGIPPGRPASALAYCSEHGLELFRHYLLAFDACGRLDRGEWADAADAAELVLRTPRASTIPRIYALVVLGLVRARRGDDDPWTPLDEAQALAEPSGELQRIGPVAAA